DRATNVFAESSNAKIKAFRTSLRGVTDIRFFLVRLSHSG
ncbi:DDE transposase, partial [Bacteroides caecimuris]